MARIGAEGQLPAFGDLLKRLRIAAGLTQEELAARARLSARGISDLERGARHTPQKETVALLAEALELSSDARNQVEAAARRGVHPYLPLGVPSTRPASGPAHDIGDLSGVPLVNRVRELDVLERHLLGEGLPVLAVAGQPGIGKSRLLRETVRRAATLGFAVLQGGCEQRSGGEAYSPLVGALASHVRRQSSPQLRAALRGCAWLVRLLPEIAEVVSEPLPGFSPQQERRLLFEAVSRFLVNVAGPAGTLLLLDDLQWAESGALDLLTSLAHTNADDVLRIVCAYRDTEVLPGDPLSATLTRLSELDLAAQLSLPSLDPGEAMALLDGLLDGATQGGNTDDLIKQQIVQRAGGLPFFLVSCARGLEVSGQAIPWNLAQSVRQRVAELSEDSQDLLRAASVVGRTVPLSVLLTMAGSPERETMTALDAACRARLLLEDDKHTYRFAHDVVREVIELDLGAGQLTLLHREAARALQQLPEPYREQRTPEIARHYRQGDLPERALPWTVLAGDRAEAVFAHAEAERQYRTALDLARDLGAGNRETEILVKLGDVLRIEGRYDEALQALEQTVPIYRAANDLEAEARVTALIGRVHFHRGTWEEGIERVQSLLNPLEARGPSPGLGDLYVALVPLFAPTGRYKEYLAAAERASDLGRSLGDERVLAQGEMWRGLALAHLRRVHEARKVLEEAVPLTESVGDLYSLGAALAFIGLTYILEGELERARTYREEAVDALKRFGDPGSVAWGTTRLGDVYFLLGSWDEARACHEQAIGMFRALGGMHRHSAVPLVSLGEVALAQGNSDEASRLLDEGLEAAVRTQHLGALRAAQYTLAEKLLLEGDPEQALAHLQPHPLLQWPGLEDSIYTMLLPVLAWTRLELGHLDDAAATIERGIDQAVAQGNRIELPQWLRVSGLMLARQDRGDLALAAFDEAATLARGMSCPYAEARARFESGRIGAEMRPAGGPQLPEQGREQLCQGAREELATALAMFQRLGARPYIERTERVLAEYGGGS